MTQYIYLNGELVSRENARISVLDHSFLYGIGVFETLKAYDGKILFLGEHIERLFRSAETICLNLPYDKVSIASAAYQTLEKNGLLDAYIRITVSQGEGEPGLDPLLCEKPTLVIYAKQSHPYPEKLYTEGVKISIVSSVKSLTGSVSSPVKSCNYLYNYLAKCEAKKRGAFEGIMLSADGFVTEGTVSNVFVVKNEKLLTSPSGEMVLDGITRGWVIKIAQDNGIKVEETNYTRSDLLNADECFLTNTSFEALPVTQADYKIIGSGKPGDITTRLARYYKEIVKRELEN